MIDTAVRIEQAVHAIAWVWDGDEIDGETLQRELTKLLTLAGELREKGGAA